MIANGTGYIKLNKFSQATYREFMQALEALQKNGLKKLILDLRGNGGGVLEEATSIADEFLDGDKLITYTQGKHFPKKEYRCQRPGLFEKGDLVVLTDEGTASASEILIGALQDWDRATVIGRRSFGKGLVQEQYDLSDGSALRLTVARYYTPIGRSIQRPYTNGEEAYYDDINKRFHDGEVTTKDSVKNDTTKIYKTIKGRTVYGGGGITPDFFVALDTSDYSPEISKLYLKGTVNSFAYKFYLQNRTTLSAFKTPADFSKNFNFSENYWAYFTTLATKDTINLSGLSSKEKDELIKRIKSTLARQIWRNEGYFEVSNVNDDTINKALEVLKN
jgi:carboxyl-terminal processing protease